MNLETSPEGGPMPLLYIIMGLITILVGGLLTWGVYNLFHAYSIRAIALWGFLIPLGIAKLYLLGYFINQISTFYIGDSDKPYCRHCGTTYCFFWTEWWHKRGCLPRQVSRVGGGYDQ